MTRVIHSAGDQVVCRVPIDPKTGAPVLVDGDIAVRFTDKRSGDELGTATVSQDALEAALTGDAGPTQPNPRRVPLAAAGALVGHDYLLVGDGHREMLRARESLADAVHAEHGVRHMYTAGDTLRGVEMRATFPDVSGDEDAVRNGGGPYVVTWTYVHDGSTVIVSDTVYVDRYSLVPTIDAAFLLMGSPTLAERARGRCTPEQAIAVAWQDYLADIEAAGKDPTTFLPSSAGRLALRHKALFYLHDWVRGGDSDTDDRDEQERRYQARMRDLLTGRPNHGTAQLDRNSDKAVVPSTGFEFIRRS